MYATRQDMVDRFGAAEIAALEPPVGITDPPSTAVEKAIAAACNEADSYIANQYTLPLPSIPVTLTDMICDMARLRLYTKIPPDEVKRRGADARAWLIKVGGGTAILIFDPPLSPMEQEAETKGVTTPYAEALGGSVGVFSDNVLGGMPTTDKAYGVFGR